MAALGCNCPPLDGVDACAPLPLAFVRLRYFFGKRLGVADFVDEQLYHAAKMRFHNQHLHGAGVVCGLRTLVLGTNGVRVTRGAAVDRCGREMIVGVDQCIDIDAWLLREIAARRAIDPNTTWPATDLDADGKLGLRVVLRYRECTTSPEAAPRDPCSCDNGGCDYGRIREGFALDLRTDAQAAEFETPTMFPAPVDLSSALAGSVSGRSFLAALVPLITAPAHDPTGEDWLVVGSLRITLDANQKTTAIEILPPPAPILLETQTIAEILLRALAVGFDPGSLVDGAPQVLEAVFSSDSGTNKTGTNNKITMTLSGPIVASTLASTAHVSRLDAASGWSVVAGVGSPAFAAGPPPTITVPVGALAPSSLYRLSLPSDSATPICDEKMRRLLPIPISWQFAVDATGNVTSAPLG